VRRDVDDRRAGVTIGTPQGNVRIDVDVDRLRPDRVRPGESAESAPAKPLVHRAREILGMSVKNAAGNDLGSVNDLVIDTDTGKIRYAALSFGGFLGLGDKLFAVPWELFDRQYAVGDEKYYLVLDIDDESLKAAPGFDQHHWPDLADPNFGDEIDKYYEKTRPSATDRRGGRASIRPVR
jgi:sporulation protein YlmC with PRC-barrel domain